jgi:hypothetical protein
MTTAIRFPLITGWPPGEWGFCLSLRKTTDYGNAAAGRLSNGFEVINNRFDIGRLAYEFRDDFSVSCVRRGRVRTEYAGVITCSNRMI